MAKKLGAIQKDGLKIVLQSGNEETYVCFAVKKTAYINDHKDIEEIGRWLIKAASIMRKEKKK